MRAARGLRQLWLRRIDDPSAVKALLRHRAFRDRAAVENALSRYFFTPFEHQEVCEGERFARRSTWSRAALSGLDPTWIEAVADRRFDAWRQRWSGRVPSLLDAVRRLTLPLMCELTVGRVPADELARVAGPALRNIDGCIKMMARPHPIAREALGATVTAVLREPPRAPSILATARGAGAQLSPSELRDHVICVFLGTGTIQLTDVLTHALVARAQHPLSVEEASVAGWLRETLRCFPVNASLTRLARDDVEVGGVAFAAGDAITVYPQALNHASDATFRPARWDAPDGGPTGSFSFGWGPRACPAQRFSLHLLTHLLRRLSHDVRVRVPAGFAHRRSLAWPIPASLGPPGVRLAAPPPRREARAMARYAATCTDTYPRAFWRSLFGGLGRR